MMEYKQKTVAVKTQYGDDPTVVDVRQKVYVAVGTGLAYRRAVNEDGNAYYILMHVGSGYCFPRYPVTRQTVQVWLEKIADLVPDRWNCSLETYLQHMQTVPQLKEQVHAAFDEAIALPEPVN